VLPVRHAQRHDLLGAPRSAHPARPAQRTRAVRRADNRRRRVHTGSCLFFLGASTTASVARLLASSAPEDMLGAPARSDSPVDVSGEALTVATPAARRTTHQRREKCAIWLDGSTARAASCLPLHAAS
jgi:hypothetical protein